MFWISIDLNFTGLFADKACVLSNCFHFMTKGTILKHQFYCFHSFIRWPFIRNNTKKQTAFSFDHMNYVNKVNENMASGSELSTL